MDVQVAAQTIGQQLLILEVSSERDIETAFATFVQRGAEALLVAAGPFLTSQRERLVVHIPVSRIEEPRFGHEVRRIFGARLRPGTAHALHAHAGMDKVYSVIEGSGVFLLDGRELPMQAGDLLIAPEGVPHGVRNPGPGRLLVLAILAPAPVK